MIRTAPRALDSTELQLAHMLRRDPRTTYEDMACRVGMSRPAVRARVQRMLEGGAVRITGAPHPRALGASVAAELLVDASLPAGQVAAVLGDQPYLRTGHADGLIVVSLWCCGDEELIGLADQLRALPEVRRVEVFRVVDLLRGFPTARITPLEGLDELDHRLMDLLAKTPRASYSHLGDQIGLSASAARARVRRLLDSENMTFEVEVDTGLSQVASRVSMSVRAPVLQVARSLLDVAGLTYLALGHGPHDILARLATTPLEQHALYQRIRDLPGVDAVQIRQLTPLNA